MFVLILLLVTYFTVAFGLSYIPIHSSFQSLDPQQAGTDVFVRSTGVHTDIMLPTQLVADFIPAADVHNESGALNYIAFGWGDKGFYLETPTWAQLKVSTALVAATGLGSTAMHVEAVEQPVVGKDVRKVRISDEQVAALLKHIKSSFVYDANGQIEKIQTTANYNQHDVFYEANGQYSIFSTCNEWTRQGLSRAHIKTAMFSLQASGVLRHLPQ